MNVGVVVKVRLIEKLKLEKESADDKNKRLKEAIVNKTKVISDY